MIKHLKILIPWIVGIFILIGIGFVSNVTRAQESEVSEAWVARYEAGSPEALTIDAAGNVYVTGVNYGSPSYYDYITIKYDRATGQPMWENPARYNGPGIYSDWATALAVDSSGNVYVTGRSSGSGTGPDYATIKYDGATGNEMWPTPMRYNGPGNGYDEAKALAVDSAGNVCVTGMSVGSNSGIIINYDYATIKYDGETSEELWVERYDGPNNWRDEARALAVDSAGNCYVTGYSEGTGLDYTTIKYDGETGEQLWISHYDGPGNSGVPQALAVDSSGNVYVTGSSSGSDTSTDYATIKYDGATGDQLWVARYDGPGNLYDAAKALAIDRAGNIYVTGSSTGSGTGFDYATIKYEGATGNEMWPEPVRYNGPDNGDDLATAIAVDNVGMVYVTGESKGSGTGFDYATIKYDGATGNEMWAMPMRYNGPDNRDDSARAMAVDSAGNVYVTGESEGSHGSLVYFATIKYASKRPVASLGTATLELDDWVRSLFICFDKPSRWLGRGDLPIPFTGPGCPPPPECLSCSLASGWDPGTIPSYLPEIYWEVLGGLDPRGRWHFPTDAVPPLAALLKKIPAGRHYTNTLKAKTLKALRQSKSAEILPPEVTLKVLEAINALELDWRVPRLSRQKVNRAEYSAIGFQGAAWVAMRNVTKSGDVELRVESGLPAAAAGFKPGWPIATYTFDFSGQLGKDGYMDVSFYTGGRRFAAPVATLRVLEWDGKSYKDITTHVDVQRGVINGRTNSPSTYVLMTPVARGIRIR